VRSTVSLLQIRALHNISSSIENYKDSEGQKTKIHRC